MDGTNLKWPESVVISLGLGFVWPLAVAQFSEHNHRSTIASEEMRFERFESKGGSDAKSTIHAASDCAGVAN